MSVRNLDKIFKPTSIAVIGASARPGSVGNTLLNNLVTGGFGGEVLPVNPKRETICGRKCYRAVADTPSLADLAVVCTPVATVADVVEQCGDAGVLGLIILTAGYREVGAEGRLLEQTLAEQVRRYPGMRVVGPNCLGVMAPHTGMNASFASDSPLPGSIALISQSGALCTSILDWSLEKRVGFSAFVSVGNMLDVGVADLIDYFATDGRTESILLYVESITEARQFMTAARAFTRSKPIVAYKAGRFNESAKAAASHTGALAGVDAVYEAALERAGIVRVFDVDDLFDCAELLASQKPPRGARLAIVTNAGGPGVMATDALLEHDGLLASLSEATLTKLNAALPSAWSHNNPVDVLGDAPPERFASAVQTVLADEGVDGVLVILTPQAMTNPTEAARAVIAAGDASPKPVLTAWMGGAKVRGGGELFDAAGVPTYTTPEQAVCAFMHLVTYARNRVELYETPRDLPLNPPLDRERLRSGFSPVLSRRHDLLTEGESKALLEQYGIPTSKPIAAHTADEAIDRAHELGLPVAMKVLSPQITHKTDVGGVELSLANDKEVRKAFEGIVARAKEKRPDADVQGVTVQRMVTSPVGCELILGAKRDPVFGSVLLVGAGGVTAELYHDRALALPPLNESLARHALESLRSWPLLTGYRGRPAVDIDKLITAVLRFSRLVADFPEIAEVDVNPLLATPDGVTALDARMLLNRSLQPSPQRPYPHLAIRPYPEEFTKHTRLDDGTPVLLRPIRSEDEPLWHALLASCSAESIHARFQAMLDHTTHEMATRFCCIDYDREIAIVAEIEEAGERKLVGVGRLVADADRQQAEYAVLVGDPWQGKGVGAMLTRYCLSVCEQWGVEHVTAETTTTNTRMIDILRNLKFVLTNSRPSGDVYATKALR